MAPNTPRKKQSVVSKFSQDKSAKNKSTQDTSTKAKTTKAKSTQDKSNQDKSTQDNSSQNRSRHKPLNNFTSDDRHSGPTNLHEIKGNRVKDHIPASKSASTIQKPLGHPLSRRLKGFEVSILKLLMLHVSVIAFLTLLLVSLHLNIWIELGYSLVSEFKWQGTGIGFALMVLIVSKGYRSKNHKLKTGQVGFAKVISVDPPRMVVFGQLSKLETRSLPILKVCSLATLNMGWRTLRTGDYLPVISSEESCNKVNCVLYHDIHPEPLEPYVSNDKQRLQILKLYSRKDFIFLDQLIAELPSNLKPNSYKVMDKSDWEFDQLIHQHQIL